MAATINEVLMSLGQCTFDVDWDPEIWAMLDPGYGIVEYYEGERLAYTGIITQPSPGRFGIAMVGRSLEFLLGYDLNSTGPIIEDRTYLSGHSRLSNGDFAGDFQPSANYWTLDDGSAWEIHPELGLAKVAANDPLADDVMVSAEPSDVDPGQTFLVTMDAVRVASLATLGRLRLRVAFEGKFTHPNIGADWSTWPATLPFAVTSGLLVCLPTPHRQLISDAANIGTNWRQFNAAVGPTTGMFTTAAGAGPSGETALVTTAAGAVPFRYVQSDSNPVTGDVNPYPITAGEKYHFSAVVSADAATTGTAELQLIVLTAAWPAGTTFVVSTVVQAGDVVAGGWQQISADLDVGEDIVGMVATIVVRGYTAGRWKFAQVGLERMAGNDASIEAPAYITDIIPERTYEWKTAYLTGPTLASGVIRQDAICVFADNTFTTLQGHSLTPTKGESQSVSWFFTPPSGTVKVLLRVYSQDVVGGAAFFYAMTVIDVDDATTVVDIMTSSAVGPVSLSQTVPVPPGAVKGHVEVVAEKGSLGWAVDQVQFIRNDRAPSPAADIVRELLLHPQTGLAILSPGQIEDVGVIEADWRILNQTDRQALSHLSRSGQVLPYAEWRTNHDATLDWGRHLFSDRTDIVLAGDGTDFFLLGQAQVTRSDEGRATDIKLVGATVKAVDAAHRDTQIVGRAVNPPTGAVDYFGHAVVSTQVAEDSTVDQRRIADSFAAYQASRTQGSVNVKVALTNDRAMAADGDPLQPGNWIYVWDPKAGLTDNSLDMALPDGRRVNPARKRILSRTRRLGPGSGRLMLRRPDGSEVDITSSVRWETASGVDLELGDFLPEFAASPEGGSASQQFRKYRIATPA